jgi:TatD DNase family protein
MTLVDTHCHLCDPKFDEDRGAALERAWAAGLAGVVEIADGESRWEAARRLAESDPRVWWSAGFHPYEAGKFDPGLPARLKEALAHPRAVAAGEIGLDYYKHCDVPRDVQRKVFSALAAAAAEAGKPLVLHCREADYTSTDAQEDMLRILGDLFQPRHPGESRDPEAQALGPGFRRGDGQIRGVAHCFQGTVEHARRFIALGFLIGIDAPVTYASGPVRPLAEALPLDALVLETDSPYLPPKDRRGRRNEPSFLTAVAQETARIKGLSFEEVARTTARNAGRLYGINFLSHG